MKNSIQFILTLTLLYSSYSGVCQITNEELSATPYFTIISDQKDAIESLPLKASDTEVNISGIVADIVVTQQYANTGTAPIEARYIFPASTRAAVYHMQMQIGDRTITAQVKEKQAAKKVYDNAKKAGKRASLLSQDRPNLFTMNVANILPGDEITVTLRYTETVESDKGIYSFIYPTTVGPRYRGEVEAKDQHSREINYSTNESVDPYRFSLQVNLSAGMPIQDISSETHDIEVKYDGLERARVLLNEPKSADRDFELTYNLMQDQVASGLLLYEGAKENHFLMTIQPPRVVRDQDIPNREYIFVVDVSGSMNGFPIAVTKQLMRNLLGNLRPEDKFNVILFASTANILSTESVYATPTDIEAAISFLSKRKGSGGTRLMNALQKASALPKCDDKLSRSVVIVTDGYIDVEKNVFDHIRQHNSEFNFYAFGIGNSINRYLIEGIAHVSNTLPLFIKSQQDAKDKADRFKERISTPVMTNIKINWGDLDVYDIEPSQLNDVLAERPIQIMGKYKGTATGDIELSGTVGTAAYKSIYDAAHATATPQNKAIQYIWAREKIKILDDYIRLGQSDEDIQKVTQMGLDYNLLTKYTSFVAVDEVPTYAAHTPSVNQPLKYPKGMASQSVSSIGVAQNSTQGIGADLTISNHAGTKSPTYRYSYGHHTMSSLMQKMMETEISNNLQRIRQSYGAPLPKGVQLTLTILPDGSILSINIKIGQLAQTIQNKISAWKLLIKPSEATDITITL